MKTNKKSNKKALFLSYDGLTDPLGQSQVLPYLRIISKYVKNLHIISFEKKKINKNEKVNLLNNTSWTKCTFSDGGILSKLSDLFVMIIKVFYLYKKHNFNILHARSYPSMHAVYILRKFFNFKIIFDMRGFWANDKVDGKIWPQNKLLYKIIFNYYKNLEKKFLDKADIIVLLTKNAEKEVLKISKNLKKKSIIIPCCADFDHFKPLPIKRKLSLKKKLNINNNSIVISYLGSIGTVYLFDQMIKFFNEVLKGNKNKKFIFLIISREPSENLTNKIINLGLASLIKNIRIVSASRAQVPNYLGLSDVMITLRMPSYSQKAASPTKIAEAFSMGIPVISNKGIGDVDNIIKKFDAGLTFNINSKKEFKNAAINIDKVVKKGGKRLRNQTKKNFSLINANKLYGEMYRSLKT